MMRHKSLVSLSQEHHHVLHLSQLLKANAPAYDGFPRTVTGKKDYAIKFYITNLSNHFMTEEQVLYPAIKGMNTKIDELFKEIFDEHKKIARIVEELKNVGNHEMLLHELGFILESHIRKEERQLFPLIQEIIPEDVLDRLEKKLNK